MNRRDLLASAATVLTARSALTRSAWAAERSWLSPQLPDGTRAEAKFVTLPGKRPLIQLSDRPPNYETPIQAFTDPITYNDRFFVRYHLAGVPDMAALREWSLTIAGDAATTPVTLTMDDLEALPHVGVAAVCQCAGNRRGLSDPHVPGVEWGYGAMGCATWRGPRLRDVLARAGVKPEAVEVWLGGADHPVLPTTPPFRKSLPISKAMADETIIATQMNDLPLPLLNGYPARVVVPGWVSTYWMKHINHIEVSTTPLVNFWMRAAYRVPTNMFAVDMPFTSQITAANWPVTEMVVNSVIGSPVAGTQVSRGGFTIQGVAWDRGHGIRRVEVSLDDGQSWQDALLDRDLGPFAFRVFSLENIGLTAGPRVLSARAISNSGETQVSALKFNPAGYQNNVPQKVPVAVVWTPLRWLPAMAVIACALLARAVMPRITVARAMAITVAAGATVAMAPAWAGDAPNGLQPGPGSDVVATACSTCHTTDYIRMNSPFLTPDGWKAEVTKMRTALGAPIDDDTAAEILTYLDAHYAAPSKP